MTASAYLSDWAGARDPIHLRYKGATTQGTEAVTLRASGPVTMQSFFDLTSGQIVKATIHEDLNVSDQYAYNTQPSRGYAAHLLVNLTETKI
jgi:hypothetical protein